MSRKIEEIASPLWGSQEQFFVAISRSNLRTKDRVVLRLYKLAGKNKKE